MRRLRAAHRVVHGAQVGEKIRTRGIPIHLAAGQPARRREIDDRRAPLRCRAQRADGEATRRALTTIAQS